MNLLKLKASTLRRNIATTVLSLGLLSSCADPVTTAVVATIIDAGVGGTGIVRGAITGFGSVYVNGVKFDVDNSSFEVDGITGKGQADLAIGMVVTINGTINSDGVTGTATSLIYDDAIEGPISALPTFVPNSDNTQKEFSILGQSIIVDSLTTRFNGIDFASLNAGDFIEVSGYHTVNNAIVATYIKSMDSNTARVELKGYIFNLNATSFKLGDINNSTIINYFNDTILKDNVSLVNGLYVEVEGQFTNTGSINAEKVEQEQIELDESDGEINLSGIITDYVSPSNFKIDGQSINANNAKEFEPDNALALLSNGVKVKVEGTVQNSVLVASSIEVKLNEVRLNAFVSSITGNTIVITYPNGLGAISVITDESTQFEDELNASLQSQSFGISNLNLDDFIEIEASVIANQITASTIKRDNIEETLIQGDVESFNYGTTNPNNSSVTILGISYIVNDTTTFEDFDNTADFFKSLKTGDNLRIKDDIPADGIADSIK